MLSRVSASDPTGGRRRVVSRNGRSALYMRAITSIGKRSHGRLSRRRPELSRRRVLAPLSSPRMMRTIAMRNDDWMMLGIRIQFFPFVKA